MTGILNILAGSISSAIKDGYFNLVSLLLPGNGTNGAQNNTFLDSSSNNFTITRNGNATQGTFSPFSQTGWSNYFDGNGDYLNIASNAAFAIGTSDFTVELFAYYTAFTQVDAIGMANWDGATWGANKWSLHLDHTTQRYKISFWVNNFNTGTQMLLSTSTIQLNQWYHIAVTRSGSTWRLFVNGVQEASATSTVNIDGGNNSPLYIGGATIASQPFNGYLSNARLVKNSAVYTSGFTVPTSPLTAITGTSILTCQANRFFDASSNALTVTKVGDVSVQAFSPFAPTASYSAATNGGSGYFDGTGDYLTVANNAAFQLGSGDFTIECWYYAQDISSVALFGLWGPSSSNASWLMYLDGSGNPVWYTSTNGSTQTASLTSSSAITLNAWNHIAISRVSGTTTVYVNGVSGGSTSTAITLFASTSVLTVGYNPIGGTSDYTVGYLSGIRVVKGTGVYTAAFTPPTAPPTAITNTSLLLNFTNGGIIDATGKNVLETVGDAQISTTQSKFGGSSMYFDGTGDYLQIPDTNLFPSGTENFTIEFWVYFSATGTIYLAGQCDSSGTVSSQSITILKTSGEKLQFYCVNSSTQYTCTSTNNLPQTTWTHIACVRNGSTLTQYINGTADGTATISTNPINNSSNRFGVGTLGEITTNTMNGYIDDFRITKGFARYTANFTPPTAAFALQ